MSKKSLGIYIHIPFCKRKCAYCDFLSFSVNNADAITAYADALCKEIQRCEGTIKFYFQENNLDLKEMANKYEVDSIFIGGGTPSLLPPQEIEKILLAVRSVFKVAYDAEVSMESNPSAFPADTAKMPPAEYFYAIRHTGVNRLSIGVQSLRKDTLRFLGRIHTKSDFLQSFTAARQAGFENINLDMMFGVPGQGIDPWREDLKEIAALRPEHISFYSLKLEEGTKLHQMYESGDFDEIDPATDRRMYGAALEILGAAGYEHYEISNAAMPGRACRHNLKYWSMDEYLGFGLGAHSYITAHDLRGDRCGVRFSNITDLQQYIATVDTLKNVDNGKSLPITSKIHGNTEQPDCKSLTFAAETHKNTEQDEISEYIFTGLRKIQGIRSSDFKNRFGNDIFELYGKEIAKLIDRQLLEESNGYLRLTKRGIDISNQVFVEFV